MVDPDDHLDADEVVNGLRVALRTLMTPESARSRSPRGNREGPREEETMPAEGGTSSPSSGRSRTPRRQPKPTEPGTPSSVDSWDARIQWKREASTSPSALRQRTEEEHQSHGDTGARGSQDDQPEPRVDDPDSDSEEELCGLVSDESDQRTFAEWKEELDHQLPHSASGPLAGSVFRQLDLDRLSRSGAFVAYDQEYLEAYIVTGQAATVADFSGTGFRGFRGQVS